MKLKLGILPDEDSPNKDFFNIVLSLTAEIIAQVEKGHEVHFVNPADGGSKKLIAAFLDKIPQT
jgi:hypothetical protein